MSENSFFSKARADYGRINAATLEWMLARPRLHGRYLNTKFNPLTLADYGAEDGLRGPDFVYGWIQGRGLEALVTHAEWFETDNPALTSRLDQAARELYNALNELVSRDGHAYFCYEKTMSPVRPLGEGWEAQETPNSIFTYSDAFVAKGLVAAASRFGLQGLKGHLAYFDKVIASIEDGGFQINEREKLGCEAIAEQQDDFGPRMILLGGAGMLKRAGHSSLTTYADRFISHVIDRHYDPATGLLRNVPGEDVCNVGHGIEFAGFALDYQGSDASDEMVEMLSSILIASFESGYTDPGVALTVSLSSGEQTSPYRPWWTLPETIRTAALIFERTRSERVMSIWQTAHRAFFEWYWRDNPSVAYQCRTLDGPVDYVPATPDLDPGYHTGLSVLAAMQAIDRMSAIKERD